MTTDPDADFGRLLVLLDIEVTSDLTVDDPPPLTDYTADEVARPLTEMVDSGMADELYAGTGIMVGLHDVQVRKAEWVPRTLDPAGILLRAGNAPQEELGGPVLASALSAGLRLGRDDHGWWVRNWPSHEESFATAEDAAKAYLEARGEDSGLATDDEIADARAEYGSEDVQIDDIAAASRGDDGTWVQAWVLLAHEDDDEETPDDQA